MAHIPEDARYVNPPDGIEANEDWVTEEARRRIAHHGFCPDCRAGVMPDAPDDVYERWADAHAEECDKLRARAFDALYGEV
jgi:hypothetical protein